MRRRRSRAAALDVVEAERILGLLGSPSGICAQASTFRWSDVVEAISTMVGSLATASEIGDLADRFVTGAGVVAVNATESFGRKVGRSAQQRWTTVELAQIESRLLTLADQGTVSPYDRPTVGVIADVVSSCPELSDEQVRMVEAVCSSDRVVLPVEGRPGAGKTYANRSDRCGPRRIGRTDPRLRCVGRRSVRTRFPRQPSPAPTWTPPPSRSCCMTWTGSAVSPWVQPLWSTRPR